LSQNEAYSVSERIHAAIVWQRKLAIPLSALVFALLAIPLSWQSHAGGRPSSFIVGIVLLGGYYYGGRALELAARDQGLDLHWAVWGPNVLGILFFFLSWWHKRWHV
jgi:lipopolysaccharide export LptBFGC system permease protein LptF